MGEDPVAEFGCRGAGFNRLAEQWCRRNWLVDVGGRSRNRVRAGLRGDEAAHGRKSDRWFKHRRCTV